MTFRLLLVAMAALLGINTANAQQMGDVFVFPNDGQDQEQTDLDTVQCQRWAREQTGFDPSQRPTASTPPPPDSGTSTGRSAAGGALAGAAVGAIIDGKSGAGKGALAGGLLGGVRGSSRNRQAEREQQQWEQQQMARYNQQRSEWNRAFAACMEGRGYTVR